MANRRLPRLRVTTGSAWAFALAIASVLCVGTLGYRAIEGWPLLEAFYMTVITVTTVGFAEVHPLSPVGRLFTVLLIAAGVGTAAYAASQVAERVLEAGLTNAFERRRQKRMLAQMSGHYIVCGYGRLGRIAAQELLSQGAQVVVVDPDPNNVALCASQRIACVQGSATEDAVLREAGVERARGLLATHDSDAENVYIVLSARALNPQLFIVARVELEESEPKLIRAGANRVLAPYAIGAKRMAALALRPTVVHFLDVITNAQDLQLWMEEVPIGPASPLANMTLAELDVQRRTGALIVAFVSPEGRVITNPPQETVLSPGSKLIALGRTAQVRMLCELAATGTCTLPPAG